MYGLALSYFQIGDCLNALKVTENAIEKIGNVKKLEEEKNHFVYVRALCFKILMRQEEADKDYNWLYK